MSLKFITLLSLLFIISCNYRATKVTVVGAGNVGATAANVLAINEVASEIILIDIKEGLAEGKAMDIMQTAQLVGFDSVVKGVTNDYSLTANSDVVVITSGVPRKPGMTREELLGTNAKIVKSVVENLMKYSPDAIIVVVANPMDAMTHLTLKLTGLPRNKVIGMGGLLDSSRFKYFLSYKGIPVSTLLPEEKIQEVVKSTMVGGATLTKLLGTSAWIAPGASISHLVESIIKDQKKLIPCSVYLQGEYGLKDITIGVPVVVGRNGIEKIIPMDLNAEELELFHNSAKAVKENEDTLKDLGFFN